MKDVVDFYSAQSALNSQIREHMAARQLVSLFKQNAPEQERKEEHEHALLMQHHIGVRDAFGPWLRTFYDEAIKDNPLKMSDEQLLSLKYSFMKNAQYYGKCGDLVELIQAEMPNNKTKFKI